MKIVIPEDGKPIKFWENGDIKFIHNWIYCVSNIPIINFAIPPKFESLYQLSDNLTVPKETSVKRVIYKIEEYPNSEGIAKYKFVRIE